ncbi:M12 family metallopeptidase [Candidatus Uabimicrobium amorphum]|uniref:Peptidase n=1 Tax=Uabimicrobium amorphum TaxID=2596890 RepID=A0A5S9F4Y1_UABAM|nr:M12 family metallopeptidase [Candidatus Uabimicrobium amorphum]BBM86287.1 peptidase [Candidatus Uabimicrobium amorphum]
MKNITSITKYTALFACFMISNIYAGNAIYGDSYRWDKGVIPYRISERCFPRRSYQRQIVKQAIAQWNNKMPLQLVKACNQWDLVVFTATRNSCVTPVGRQSGQQKIHCDVSTHFTVGHVLHEIGHAAGLHHEHERVDRDRYITVHKQSCHLDDLPITHNAQPVGNYDYQSIMHAPKFMGSYMLHAPAAIGQRDRLSCGDVSTIIATNFDGKLVQAPGLPVALVQNGKRTAVNRYGSGCHSPSAVLQLSSKAYYNIPCAENILGHRGGFAEDHRVDNGFSTPFLGSQRQVFLQQQQMYRNVQHENRRLRHRLRQQKHQNRQRFAAQQRRQRFMQNTHRVFSGLHRRGGCGS